MSEGQVEIVGMDPGAGAAPEATPEVAPAATPTPAPDWRSGYSEEVRSHPITQRMAGPEAALKELIGVQSLIGADKVVVPGEDATAEQRDAFQVKLGRPQKADGYNLEGLDIPEGLNVDEDFQTAMVGALFGEGASQQLVGSLLNQYYAADGARQEAHAAEVQRSTLEGMAALAKENGTAHPAFMANAKKGFMTATGEDWEATSQMKLEDGRILGDTPFFLKAFAQVGSRMNEHGLVGANAVPTSAALTPGDAQAEIDRNFANEKFFHAYTHPNDPEHKTNNQRMQDLFAMANPEEE